MYAYEPLNNASRSHFQKHRRPVAEGMLSIRVCDVRPLVEVNQQTIRLPQMGDSLSLLWRWRSGGCLGPEAAAAMNARQRQPREDRPAAEPPLDRGATGGWHLDLVCPLCSRICRRLFAPTWSQPARPSRRPWGCRSCHRVTYESSNRPGSSRGRGLARKLRSGDFPLPYLGEGTIHPPEGSGITRKKGFRQDKRITDFPGASGGDPSQGLPPLGGLHRRSPGSPQQYGTQLNRASPLLQALRLWIVAAKAGR
jgi:hypothetical protein